MALVETLIVDIAASWVRMFAALLLSILFSIYVGIAAATDQKKERVILPLLDILQTIPILGFFPIVIYLVVLLVPGFVGVNIAVIFLIFTSMVWNISFGVYEAVKSIPTEIIELAKLNHFSGYKLYSTIYIPAAMPRIAYQTVISWSVGLFYLVTSEIFSTGSANFSVTNGIGVGISQLAANGNTYAYALALVLFIIAVILTRMFFLQPLSVFAEQHSFREDTTRKRSRVLDFYIYAWARIKRWLRPFVIIVRSSRVFLNKSRGSYKFLEKSVRRYITSPTERFKMGTRATILVIAVLIIALWYAAFSIGLTQYLPTVLSALGYSFARVWIVYIICACISVPLGIYIGLSHRLFEPALSTLQVISAIPATILLPAIVAIFVNIPSGGELAAVIVIFLAMIWYILFSVISGVRTIPEQMFELKKMMHMKKVDAWRNIYIPAILPSFITGSITAIGGAWNSLIVAEYFTVQSGGNQLVLTQVNTGIGKLIDFAITPPSGVQPNLYLAIMALAAMVIMVIAINRFFWQRIYNRITSKYRIGG